MEKVIKVIKLTGRGILSPANRGFSFSLVSAFPESPQRKAILSAFLSSWKPPRVQREALFEFRTGAVNASGGLKKAKASGVLESERASRTCRTRSRHISRETCELYLTLCCLIFYEVAEKHQEQNHARKHSLV